MKIDLDRLLLLIVPVLFIVSAAYYQGYWVPFRMDVYNYLDVSDIIKGVGRPAFEAIIIAAFFSLGDIARPFFLFLEEEASKQWIKKIIDILMNVLPMLISILAVGYFLDFRTEYLLAYTACTFLSLIISIFYDKLNDSLTSFQLRTFAIIISTLLFWPLIIYIKGRDKAEAILNNKQFEYLILPNGKDSPTKNIYKFLGKAGSYYFFISYDNRNKAIIAASEMNRLDFSSFDESNITSKKDFKTTLDKIFVTTAPSSPSVSPAPPSPPK